MQSAECKVQSAECRVQSAECKVQSAKCRVQSAECRVQSAECKVQSAECKVQSAKCRVQSAECRVQSAGRGVHVGVRRQQAQGVVMPVNWYGDRVAARVRGAQRLFIRAVALQVEGQTKVNIVANNQVDTGFMLNSVYTAAPDINDYADAVSNASGRNAEAIMAPAQLPADDMSAIVGVGASYALYQEERHSFLLAAIWTVANQLPNVQVVDLGLEPGERSPEIEGG